MVISYKQRHHTSTWACLSSDATVKMLEPSFSKILIASEVEINLKHGLNPTVPSVSSQILTMVFYGLT